LIICGCCCSDALNPVFEGDLTRELVLRIPPLLNDPLASALSYNLSVLVPDATTLALTDTLAQALAGHVGKHVSDAIIEGVVPPTYLTVSKRVSEGTAEILENDLPHYLQRAVSTNVMIKLTNSITHAVVPSVAIGAFKRMQPWRYSSFALLLIRAVADISHYCMRFCLCCCWNTGFGFGCFDS
jgi:hypothetical protein